MLCNPLFWQANKLRLSAWENCKSAICDTEQPLMRDIFDCGRWSIISTRSMESFASFIVALHNIFLKRRRAQEKMRKPKIIAQVVISVPVTCTNVNRRKIVHSELCVALLPLLHMAKHTMPIIFSLNGFQSIAN